MLSDQGHLSDVRLLLHALDRTGPPVLALAFGRWLRRELSGVAIHTVAFRGGPLIDQFVEIGGVSVLLDPSEHWDHERPDAAAEARVRSRCADVPTADVMLAVSVAGTHSLKYLPRPLPSLVSWVVERGSDLRWVTPLSRAHTGPIRWLAGSRGSAEDLASIIGADHPIPIVAEFVEGVGTSDDVAANCRTALGAGPDDLLVVAAGIATERKAPDLFIEVGAAARRDGFGNFVWLGGEQDAAFHTYLAESRRLGAFGPRFFGNVGDVDHWLAAADVLCHPARLDSFPLVCLHAALASTPVVGFAEVAGLEEMFGSAAVTVPYPDVDAMVEELRRFRDPARRAKVAEAQRRAVTSRHVVDVAGPDLLRELVQVWRSGGLSA